MDTSEEARINLRLPMRVLDGVKEMAHLHHRSVTGEIIRALEEWTLHMPTTQYWGEVLAWHDPESGLKTELGFRADGTVWWKMHPAKGYMYPDDQMHQVTDSSIPTEVIIGAMKALQTMHASAK